jgi:hypothetical protein
MAPVIAVIEMLGERQQRRPRCPISWSEQAELMKHSPKHLRAAAEIVEECPEASGVPPI